VNTSTLTTSTPEAQGVPSAAIAAFVDAAEAYAAADPVDALHSLTVVRHGQVVAEGWWEPYQRPSRHLLFSISKSFTSTAVGLAVDEGLLSIDDPVLGFFGPERPSVVSDHLAAMRVRHLLTMTTGHAEDTVDRIASAPDGDWAKAFLALAVEHEPGTTFVYNSGATYLLAAILARRTGTTLLDYLTPRLFDPLGIEAPTWTTCPRGVNVGGWGLSVRSGDLARFGQLYLNEGRWQGRQLIPRDWVRAATAWQVPNDHDAGIDWQQGYGYQFWRCRHGAYRGDGAFGQFCVVLPEQDTVVALTAGVTDMQAILDLVWTHLLPALGPAALPPDPAAHGALTARLGSLALEPVRGLAEPALPARRVYTVTKQPADSQSRAAMDLPGFPALTGLAFTPADGGWTVTFQDERGAHDLACGLGEWRRGTFDLFDPALPVAASGAWTGEDTFTVRMCLPELPFVRTLTCAFNGPDLIVTVRDNVAFTAVERPPIIARLAD
jgi:CubicO group peptidase (beta-lactamase class C family)